MQLYVWFWSTYCVLNNFTQSTLRLAMQYMPFKLCTEKNQIRKRCLGWSGEIKESPVWGFDVCSHFSPLQDTKEWPRPMSLKICKIRILGSRGVFPFQCAQSFCNWCPQNCDSMLFFFKASKFGKFCAAESGHEKVIWQNSLPEHFNWFPVPATLKFAACYI